MTIYDKIYEIAADNFGLITSAEAKKVGASDKELSRFASDGRLIRIGRGLYRTKYHVSEPLDQYAEAVALVGSDACLYGESVVAMLDLAPTNPKRMMVASRKRVRKTLPSWLKVVKCNAEDKVTIYDGVPSQTVYDAILACRGKVMADRLLDAVDNAVSQGYLSTAEAAKLSDILEKDDEATQ